MCELKITNAQLCTQKMHAIASLRLTLDDEQCACVESTRMSRLQNSDLFVHTKALRTLPDRSRM